MSRLPPRCPFQSRSLSPATHMLDESRLRHRRVPSLGSIQEEQPAWLDDLLSDSESRSIRPEKALRRTASDPVAILDAALAFRGPASPEGAAETGVGSGSGFEGSCVYGPNSPRSREADSKRSVVAALLENVSWNQSQCVSDDAFGVVGSDVSGDVRGGGRDAADLEKATRRRSGQRSRVRKLQYIAELERNIEDIQALGEELAAQVSCIFQQRVALSMENKNLKQQMIILRQEKMIKEGQYKSLVNEIEMLKRNYGRHRRSKSAASRFEMGCVETDQSDASWQMLDMGKLSLGGSRFL